MKRRRSAAPKFRPLDSRECRALLARNHVGRLAFAFREVIGIEPVHYVYARGTIVLRTSPGTKFDVLRHHPWVALEVDETEGMFDWQSVVAHGTIYQFDAAARGAAGAGHAKAVRQLRRLLPSTLTEADPTPARDIVLRLYIDHLTGRAATTEPSPARRPLRVR